MAEPLKNGLSGMRKGILMQGKKPVIKLRIWSNKLKDAIKKIDREMIETWVKDLVLYKTFIGLRFQEAILKKVADIKETTYRLATKEEESRGIDGYIGYIPVSIKPHTYRSKANLAEEITVQIIYYEKKKGGITIEFDF